MAIQSTQFTGRRGITRYAEARGANVMVDKKQAKSEMVAANVSEPVAATDPSSASNPETMTRPYKLREGFVHHVGHQEVKAGDTVQLTSAQYLAFSDRFQPMTSTGEGEMPTSAAAATGIYQDVLANSVSDIVKHIESDAIQTPAQLRELAASEQLGKNRGEVLDAIVKRLSELEQ